MTDPEFLHDYDLGSVTKIRTKGLDFDFYVTPRFLNHYVKNFYEYASARLVRQNAKGVASFIDIGAHYGYYSVVAGLSNPACNILAFEPVPENAEILRRNLELHSLQGTVHQVAISDHSGRGQLEVSEAGDNSGLKANPAVGVIRSLPVDVARLDDYVDTLPPGPILIKIDTEGHEMHVLEGMKGLIASREDVRLLVEFNPICLEASGATGDALLAQLRGLGFDLFFVHEEEGWFEPFIPDRGWSRDLGTATYRNLFCIKRERSANMLFFSHSAQWAGAERSMFEVVDSVTRKFGALCTVVLPYEGPLAAALRDIGTATLIMPYEWWCTERPLAGDEVRRKMRSSYLLVHDAQDRLEAMAPDVVITNTVVIPWGAVAALHLNKPHIWWIKEFGQADHGLNFHYTYVAALNTVKEAANVVVVNTPALKRELFPELPEGKCIVATEANHALPAPNLSSAEASPFRLADSMKLIIMGRVSPGKGHDDAVNAVARLVHDGANVELCVLGPADSAFADGLRRLAEQERIGDRVHFVGFRQNVREILDLVDISLTCSKYEAFGRVTSEAMAAGKPVIGTTTGGTPDMIEDGITGFLYPPGDVQTLAEKIQYFLKHPKRIVEFGNRGREAVARKLAVNPDDIQFQALCQQLKAASNADSARLKNLVLDWQRDLLLEFEAELAEKLAREEQLVLEIERTAQRMEASKAEAVEWVKGKAAEVERNLLGRAETAEHNLDAVGRRLHSTENDLAAVRAELAGVLEQFNTLQESSEAHRARLETQVQSLHRFVQAKDQDLRAAAEFIEAKDQDIRAATAFIQDLHRSIAWRLTLGVRSITERLAPPGSVTGGAYRLLTRAARRILRMEGSTPTPAAAPSVQVAETKPPAAPTPTEVVDRRAICTIASKNYLSQVRVLAASLAESNPGLELYVLLVDRPDNKFDPDEEPYRVITVDELTNIPNPNHFFFKYDAIELNTAVKPYFLEHLFQKFGLQKVIYLDPDIYVFGELAGIWDLLLHHGVVVTPHITAPYQDDRRPTELDLVRAGIFNLGFLAISRNERTRRLLDWWKTRLYDYGYMQPALGMHVDQSWMAFAPAFQDDVFILRDPAYNIAYWNLHERGARLRFADQMLFIDHRPVVFFHFSGMEMENLNLISRHQNRFTLADFENLRPLFEFYRRTVELHGSGKTRNWGYAFGCFDNGSPIPAAARRLYGELAADAIAEFGNPFETGSTTSFFAWMNQSAVPPDAPKHPVITHLHLDLHRQRPDLQRAFPQPLGADRERYKSWILQRGAEQVGLDAAMLREDSPEEATSVQPMVARTPFRVRLQRRAFAARSAAVNRVRGRLNPHGKLAAGLRALDQRVFPSPQPPVASTTTPAATDLPFGVNVAGYIEGEFGVAEGARASLEALTSVVVPHTLNNIRADVHRHEDRTFQSFGDENPYRVNLIHVNADQVPVLLRQKGEAYLLDHYNVGYWFWELSRFPNSFWPAFAPFQEIWVASAFVQDSISSVSPIPVIKMPFPVLVGESPELIGRAELGLPEDQYVFGFSFDFLSVPERKNPLGVIRAFRRAFGEESKALLVIKSINAEHAPEQAAALREAAAGSNVRFIENHMSRAEMMALSASLDCYVSLHRSEGFGIGLAQAMHSAKPVIATGYSGNMEFMNAANSFLVRYELAELEQDYGPYRKGNVWAQPDLDHAASLMRFVFTEGEAAAKVAQRGQADVRRMLAPRRAGEAMLERLQLVLGLPGSGGPQARL